MIELKNKTILVTGASSGIGRATAILCDQLGANVIITGRNADELNKTKTALKNKPEAHSKWNRSRAGIAKYINGIRHFFYFYF